jgi:alkyl hydroperoxide reductase subunit AhpF
VRLAQHMAVASDKVTATAIEATEFPELSRSYRVMAVPKVVINDRVEFEGALPEAQFLEAVLRAAAPAAS